DGPGGRDQRRDDDDDGDRHHDRDDDGQRLLPPRLDRVGCLLGGVLDRRDLALRTATRAAAAVVGLLAPACTARAAPPVGHGAVERGLALPQRVRERRRPVGRRAGVRLIEALGLLGERRLRVAGRLVERRLAGLADLTERLDRAACDRGDLL